MTTPPATNDEQRDAWRRLSSEHRRLADAPPAGFALPWTFEDSASAGAAAWLVQDQHRAELAPIVGLVGGASSGKSTLFNNLVRALNARAVRDSVSRVGVGAHTTKGVVVAAPESLVPRVGAAARTDRLLGAHEARVTPAGAAATPGQAGALTVTPYRPTSSGAGPLVVDTPDCTTWASRDAGDIARAILPWFDRVLLVIDEDRWYDAQIFDWLGERLRSLGVPVLIVFNQIHREAAAQPDIAARLERRAAELGAEHELLDRRPGRGAVELAPESVDRIVRWLAAPAGQPSTEQRLADCGLRVGAAARTTLEERDRRAAALGRLTRTAQSLAKDAHCTRRAFAYNVLLTPAQRERIDPMYQLLAGPAAWAREAGRAVTESVPLGKLAGRVIFGRGRGKRDATEQEGEIGKRATRYIEHRLSLLRAKLDEAIETSELRERLGAGPDTASRASDDALLADAGAAARACEIAYEKYASRLEREARSSAVKAASTSGAALGATLGGIAGAAGGITLPAGLLLGAAIGGSGAAIGSRGLVRLTRAIAKTPESRELWDAVDACAAILADAASREAQLAVDRLGAHVLTDRSEDDRRLLDALRVAAATTEGHP